MPRRARLAIAGIPWHVIHRGHNRSACFHSGRDYRFYLDALRVHAEEHGCAVHAYVLMTNHVHLLLTPERLDSVSLTMKHVAQRHTRHMNRTYGRTGTLWEGRFKSCLAGDERYTLTCYRYIELNPVRAGMVRDPAEYRWSSYRANAGGTVDALIRPHEHYQALGAGDEERRRNYRSLVETGLSPEVLSEIRNATNGNYVYGTEEFQEEVSRTLQRRASRGRPGRRGK